VLFGPRAYGHRQGLLMVPARMAQALAPWLFGICLTRWGANAMWLSAALGLLAFAALLLLRDPGAAETAIRTGSTRPLPASPSASPSSIDR
jgi:hypothetical protein